MKEPATLDEFHRAFPAECRIGRPCARCAGPTASAHHDARAATRTRCRHAGVAGFSLPRPSLAHGGTPIHGTRVVMRTDFPAMFFGARHEQGISALQFPRDTGLGRDEAAAKAVGFEHLAGIPRATKARC